MICDDVTVRLCDYSYHTHFCRHTHKNGLECYIIRLQMEGNCKALVNNEYRTILPGHLLLFPPGERYDLIIGEHQNDKPSGDYYVLCSGKLIDEWWQRSSQNQLTRISTDGRLQEVWNQIILESRRTSGGDKRLLSLLLQALLILIDRAITDASSYSTASAATALRIKYYIESNAQREITINEIAAYVSLSVSRVSHIFKNQFGMSIIKYAQQMRLHLALELMENTTLNLENIAEQSGFGSYTFFYRVFRKHYGVSPKVYRNR